MTDTILTNCCRCNYPKLEKRTQWADGSGSEDKETSRLGRYEIIDYWCSKCGNVMDDRDIANQQQEEDRKNRKNFNY